MASAKEDEPFNSAALPTTAPTPKPSAPAPVPKSRPPRHLIQHIDILLSRLSLILSTPSGTDSLLRTVTYTLQFLSGALFSLATQHLAPLTKTLDASKTALPANGFLTSLALPAAPAILRLSPRARALSGVISDFRAFTRLWGLLGMYAWGKSLWAGAGPRDGVLRACAWLQCSAYTVYQVYENRAYLAGKGVIAREGKLILRDWLWSARWWMVAVAVEFVRLARVRALWRREDAVRAKRGEKLTGEDRVKREKEVALWKGEVLVNLSNAPLTVHWSTDGGTLSDTTVGFLGMVAGLVGFSQRWKASGLQVGKS